MRTAFLPLVMTLLLIAPTQGEAPNATFVDAAASAGQKYNQDLINAGVKLQEMRTEIVQEAQRKSAVATTEYETTIRHLREAYVTKLEEIHDNAEKQNQADEAKKILEKINLVKNGPEENEIQKFWVSSFEAEELQNYDEAIEAVNQAIEIGGKQSNAFVYLRLGWLNYLNKNYESAIDSYRLASQQAPRAISPYQGLLNCFLALDQTDDAINAAKRILLYSPGDKAANSTIANLYYKKQDYKNAATYYGAIVSLNPEDLETWSSLAWCWAKEGKVKEAENVFLDILAVDPDQLGALTGYAEIATLKKSQANKE
ncbi:MAG: tetratricopeptide repeat protein [Planctomycetaceae bacterium]|nr:tetratricopeptide repeat protein [Planctomycetaceae bacterium]